MVVGVGRADDVGAEQSLGGAMVEDGFVPEGDAVEGQGFELGNEVAELAAVEVDVAEGGGRRAEVAFGSR